MNRATHAAAAAAIVLAMTGGRLALAQTEPVPQTDGSVAAAPHHHHHGDDPGWRLPPGDPRQTPVAEQRLAEARDALTRGAFAQSAGLSSQAREGFAAAGDTRRFIDATLAHAAAQQALGRRRAAVAAATDALEAAALLDDPAMTLAARVARGSAAMQSQDSEIADADLSEAAALLESHPRLAPASAWVEIGNLRAAGGDIEAALQAYDRAAGEAADPGMRATALANAALAAAAAGETSRLDAARAAADALPDSYARGHLLLTLASAAAEASSPAIPDVPVPTRAALSRQAFDLAVAAGEVGVRLDHAALQSYAAGQIADLYARQRQSDEALATARRAAFLAQRSGNADAIFRRQWRLGQLLRDTGDADAALPAYRRALETLRNIRHDLAISIGTRNPRRTFRNTIGAVYYEAADLLLRRADALAGDPAAQQRALLEARDTIELLKNAELEDFFQDDCVNLIREKQKGIDVGLVNTAVVYMIPLADRTELLVTTPSGMRRFTSPVSDATVSAESQATRRFLEDAMDHSYRPHARRLYDWLVRPYAAELKSGGIDTLVFVPDGDLRTISMAALMDGNRFLIDDFAVAVSPALSLTDPQPLGQRRNVQLLAAGLSQSRENFAALPNVPAELDAIGRLYESQQLRDEAFVRQQFANRFRGEAFTIVHIASHGMFAGKAEETFLLTYDGRLKLNDLERLIQPSQFRGEPVELLTLSACQTAAGEDGGRAALGLAGIAIKAGARSALATLWSVNDEASSALIGQFYAELRERPEQTKARALRAAQQRLRESGYKHPYYWAPYLIIGNWK